MKPNKNLINEEIKQAKRLMEYETTIMNYSDLNKNGNNWSASYHNRLQQGLKPYLKNGYEIFPIGDTDTAWVKKKGGFSLTKAIYMTPEQAEELNDIGQQIRSLILQYNEKFKDYGKE